MNWWQCLLINYFHLNTWTTGRQKTAMANFITWKITQIFKMHFDKVAIAVAKQYDRFSKSYFKLKKPIQSTDKVVIWQVGQNVKMQKRLILINCFDILSFNKLTSKTDILVIWKRRILITWNLISRPFSKPGGLDWSRRDLDRDLDLDAQKISVSTVEKISTVFKS